MTWSQVNKWRPGSTYHSVNNSKTASPSQVQQQLAHLRHKNQTIQCNKISSKKGQNSWLTITKKCPKQTWSRNDRDLWKWLLHHSANIIQSRSFMHLSLNVIWTNSADLAWLLCMKTWGHVTAQSVASCYHQMSSTIIICMNLLA